ncbi:cytochrome P450 78A3-like [Trifolium medium]|uniref:Cytochrome P450 78A3-like n=1 Tax=Trifolium medium TaxID=97028 RepID=A0A392PF04_9FABA|nr:cytochrome P450 78A3-like [Trifolium medium]
MALLWLTMTFFYWSHPGGPAWGKYYYSNNNKNNNLNSSSIFIPGPKGYPLIGSMNLMSSSLAHQRIASTAKTCKATRLMAFSLGDTRAIVTCNPDVAKEILHSSVFADRPIKESAYSLMFNRAIGFAPYETAVRTAVSVLVFAMF